VPKKKRGETNKKNRKEREKREEKYGAVAKVPTKTRDGGMRHCG